MPMKEGEMLVAYGVRLANMQLTKYNNFNYGKKTSHTI